MSEIISGLVDITQESESPASLFSTESEKLYSHTYKSLSSRKEDTPLSIDFFSKSNINILQNHIRYQVYRKMDKVIDNQSELDLKIIMTSIYETYGKNQSENIKDQVSELNNIVIDKSVTNIITNLKQYLGYVIDKSSLPMPMDRPSYNINSEQNKSLRYNLPF